MFPLAHGILGSGSESDPLAELFANGEQGFWIHGTQIGDLFQDAGMSVPVTGTGQSILGYRDISGNDVHVTQTVNALQYEELAPGAPLPRSTIANSEFIPLPTILGLDTAYMYLSYYGARSVVSVVDMTIAGQTLSRGRGLVAAVVLDRPFTDEEIAALDAIYSTPTYVSIGTDYSGFFWDTAIKGVETDIAADMGSAASRAVCSSMFRECDSLVEMPVIDNLGASLVQLCEGSGQLTTVPALDMAEVATIQAAWNASSSLVNFPSMSFPKCEIFERAWRNCNSLPSFSISSLKATGRVVFEEAWSGCASLTSFNCPDLPPGSAFGRNNLDLAWRSSGITSFPDISLGFHTSRSSWENCSGLSSFLVSSMDKSSDTRYAWRNCTSLTSFSTNFGASTGQFLSAWQGCTSLSDFGAGLFDNCTTSIYSNAFRDCALTQTSVDNILVSVDTSGVVNGNIHIGGGTNAAPGTAGATAVSNLIGKGWTVTTN